MARKQDDSEIYEIDTGIAEIIHEPDGSMLLMVNGVPSSHIVPGEPERLDFEYMRWIAAAIEETRAWEKPRLTHLGGAGCSLPRYFAHVWPHSRNTVVEWDMDLAQLAREKFDIPRSPLVKIRVGDAREVTDSFVDASRDVIIRDVFESATTPRSLTTLPFYRSCLRSLSSDGLYVANCGARGDLQEAREELAGMAEVFPHLAVIADPPMLKGRRYGNIILLGSTAEIRETPELTRRLLGGGVPAHFKGDAWARDMAASASPRQDEPAS